ncbi:MAG: phosphatase PAP2 family protein [Acidimicrobiia bacterium]
MTVRTRRNLFAGRHLRDGSTIYWWVEILAILAFYLVYSAIRNANEGGQTAALHNAETLIEFQRSMGIFVEETLQDWAQSFRPLIIAMNYFYGSLHFVATAGVGIYLFRRWSDDYPLWRNTLAITTSIALLGFIFWPLMPPRLLDTLGGADYGFADTLAQYPTFWSFNSGAVAEVSNQFAAMPSVHVAWALWCAAAMFPRVQRRWVRALFVAYPVMTIIAIVLTGNHYILDAVGGAVVLAIGYGVARLITRAGRRQPAGESDPATVAAPTPDAST